MLPSKTRLIVGSLLVVAFLCSACKPARKTADDSNTMVIMNNGKIRHAAVAGQFYPAAAQEVNAELKAFFSKFAKVPQRDDIQAVVVPHAGWVFSGEVAASAFARINPAKRYKRIFLIGPSHQVYLDSISVASGYGFYETPLGKIEIDTQVCNQLAETNPHITFSERAHAREHCLEVQLPFLQYWLKEMPPIVPIIIATDDIEKCIALKQTLEPYFNTDNLFVFSSDFSHYPSYADANKVDHLTGEAVESGNMQMLASVIERLESKHIRNLSTCACGAVGLYTLLSFTTNEPSFNIEHIMYRNSGDSEYGEKDRVVGYHSFIVYQNTDSAQNFSLTHEEKCLLLDIAHNSIESKLRGIPRADFPLSPALKTKCGAFVTLNKNGRLRGCIGHFGEHYPLHETVFEMARAAAFEDYRFDPVTPSELDDISIEISVLTPLRRITDISEFKYGKHGIYIQKGGRGGTFLPQVAFDTDWTKEEFLGHCSRDKAGLGWDGWKDADLYIYDALIFAEE